MIGGLSSCEVVSDDDVHKSWLSFDRILWISPWVFTAHALEDAPRLAEWMSSVPIYDAVTRPQLIVALVFLGSLCWLSVMVAAKRDGESMVYLGPVK